MIRIWCLHHRSHPVHPLAERRLFLGMHVYQALPSSLATAHRPPRLPAHTVVREKVLIAREQDLHKQDIKTYTKLRNMTKQRGNSRKEEGLRYIVSKDQTRHAYTRWQACRCVRGVNRFVHRSRCVYPGRCVCPGSCVYQGSCVCQDRYICLGIQGKCVRGVNRCVRGVNRCVYLCARSE